MNRENKDNIPDPVLDGGRAAAARRAAPVLDTVRELTAEQHGLPIGEITPGTHFFDDLDDSLDHVQLLMACEEAFALTIPDLDAQHLTTVGKLAAYIEGRLAEERAVDRQPWAGAGRSGGGTLS